MKKRSRTFTADNPPKSGKSLKLWKWIIAQGFTPTELSWETPGHWARSAGAASFFFNVKEYGLREYQLCNVDNAIRGSIKNARFDSWTGEWWCDE